MSRHFSRAASDSITCSTGALSDLLGGPSTAIVLHRPAGLTKGTLVDVRTAADYVVESHRTESTGYTWCAYAGATGFQRTQTYGAGSWRIDAWSKDAGTAAIRGHSSVAGGAWTHTDYGARPNSATAAAKIQLGYGTYLNGYDGDLAVVAIVQRVVGDAELEAGLWTGMAAWRTLIGVTDAVLYTLDQPSTADPVLDLTGGGADQTAISGTTIADDPAGFDWTLIGGVLSLSAPTPALSAAGTVVAPPSGPTPAASMTLITPGAVSTPLAAPAAVSSDVVTPAAVAVSTVLGGA